MWNFFRKKLPDFEVDAYIDTSMIADSADGDPEVMASILESVQTELRHSPSELAEHFAVHGTDKDFAGVAHRFKSAAVYINNTGFTQILQSLEDAQKHKLGNREVEHLLQLTKQHATTLEKLVTEQILSLKNS